MALLKRLAETGRERVDFELDGRHVQALDGDTVLTAILTQGERLRVSEFSEQARAGFCLIGACQDCWVRTVDGAPMRACTTMLAPGMRVVTGRLCYVRAAHGAPALQHDHALVRTGNGEGGEDGNEAQASVSTAAPTVVRMHGDGQEQR